MRREPRRAEIGRLICEGYTNREIAERLGIAAKTVETHINRLLHEHHARNTRHLVGLLVRRQANGVVAYECIC